MLFEKFEIGIERIGETMKISDEEANRGLIAKEEFLALLSGIKSGIALVKEVYDLHDRLTSEFIKNNPIACGEAGSCGSCCRQLVVCTTLEMELIVEYLKSLAKPFRKKIVKNALMDALKFYFQNEKTITSSASPEIISEHLLWAHRGKRCIYLGKFNRCMIYPVRPIDCRIAKSAEKCFEGDSKKEHKTIRLYFDQVASNIIMDEEERINGSREVIPLISWPTNKKMPFFKK
jgi:Fe-S-cluster containining protein